MLLKQILALYLRTFELRKENVTYLFPDGEASGEGTYYDENDEMKKAISYEYPNKNTMIVSSINSKGKIIEKRLIPLNLDK